MKTTRRILAAANLQLQAQLAATGHETRKGMRAQMASLTEQNNLLERNEAALRDQVSSLGATVTRLSNELKALQTPTV